MYRAKSLMSRVHRDRETDPRVTDALGIHRFWNLPSGCGGARQRPGVRESSRALDSRTPCGTKRRVLSHLVPSQSGRGLPHSGTCGVHRLGVHLVPSAATWRSATASRSARVLSRSRLADPVRDQTPRPFASRSQRERQRTAALRDLRSPSDWGVLGVRLVPSAAMATRPVIRLPGGVVSH